MPAPEGVLPAMRPAYYINNPMLVCRNPKQKCGWRGLRCNAIKAGLEREGEVDEYFVAQCPLCKTFWLHIE